MKYFPTDLTFRASFECEFVEAMPAALAFVSGLVELLEEDIGAIQEFAESVLLLK